MPGVDRRVTAQRARGLARKARAPDSHRRVAEGVRPRVAVIIDVRLDDSVRVARDLGTEEGILGGISSGAIVWAALELAKRPENNGKLIVAIVCDYGERYISTVLFDDIRE